jgi:VIT1/CCC1 family predicted Fe2+/Mn2+ transporter
VPQTPHVERHFTAGDSVRDVVIGMSDGLTVPFALAAGLSGAIGQSHIVVTAGFAEIAAGAIAMGLGGYMAARGDSDHYESERRREQYEVAEKRELEKAEVAELLHDYGVGERESGPVVEALAKRPDQWVDFMMRFELGLERPDPRRARRSALTIAVSYMLGGLIPLSPYLAISATHTALVVSIAVTLVALVVFGWAKGRATGANPARGALQTTLIGGLAAAAAYGLARLIT